jgi:hypothetical protein
MEVAVEWVPAARSSSMVPVSPSTMLILATALPQRDWEAAQAVLAAAVAVSAATVVPHKAVAAVMPATVVTILVLAEGPVVTAEAISVGVAVEYLAPLEESGVLFLWTR